MLGRQVLALVGLALAAALGAAAEPSHYEVLGVARDADVSSIKKAYYQLALSNHPDKQPTGTGKGRRGQSSARRMEQINEAWGVLGDAEQRARYDRELQLREAHPSQSADGSGSRGFEPAAAPLATVHIYCTLRQLAGVAVFSGVGRVDDSGRRRGLPPYLPLPPMWIPAGSADGDRLLANFQGAGVIEFVLHEVTHRRFSRVGDDLFVTRHVPAWHNWRAPRLCVRDLMGDRHELSRRGERLRGRMEVRTVRNAGFPVKGAGRARGHLRVEVRRRSLLGSLTRRGLLLGLCSSVGALARHLQAIRGTERATKYRRLTKRTVKGGGRVFGNFLDLADLVFSAF